MTDTTISGPRGAGLFDRDRTIATAGFNRWIVPPAALATHLCIGMIYGLSVFWLPLTKVLSQGAPAAACPDMTMMQALFTTTCDWRVTDLIPVFSIGIVMLGLAAALFGSWLETAGPRKAGAVSATLWAGGFLLGALGVYVHQLWLIWIGIGLLGGIGLGIGYITPVSTLIKWFPDRRGMATGLAIMGFGGGAMIGSPLADLLIKYFHAVNPASVGAFETLAVMGVGYFLFMMFGAFLYRVPPNDWAPEGWTPPAAKGGMIATGSVHLRDAHKTPQFWLLWIVLCMNVSAGIGVLAVASPMLQEIFGGALIGQPGLTLGQLDAAGKTQVAAIAAGFVGILSLFNIAGRLFWASMSDKLGRKMTYALFFVTGMALYASAPTAATLFGQGMFVLIFCVILSMYGGGFATIPAYLADIFGTKYVGAIHGRLLTAWSTAGIVGPVVVAQLRQAQQAAGVQGVELYSRTLYILAGFLVVGLIADMLVRPVASKWLMSDKAGGDVKDPKAPPTGKGGSYGIGKGGISAGIILPWLLVGIPLVFGVYKTAEKALILFK